MPTGNKNGTWDSDYAFIYEFIAIIEKLFQVIANFFSSLGGNSGNTEGGNAEGGNAENA